MGLARFTRDKMNFVNPIFLQWLILDLTAKKQCLGSHPDTSGWEFVLDQQKAHDPENESLPIFCLASSSASPPHKKIEIGSVWR